MTKESPLGWLGSRAPEVLSPQGSSFMGPLKYGPLLESFPGALAQRAKSHVMREEAELIPVSSAPKMSALLALSSRLSTDPDLQ